MNTSLASFDFKAQAWQIDLLCHVVVGRWRLWTSAVELQLEESIRWEGFFPSFSLSLRLFALTHTLLCLLMYSSVRLVMFSIFKTAYLTSLRLHNVKNVSFQMVKTSPAVSLFFYLCISLHFFMCVRAHMYFSRGYFFIPVRTCVGGKCLMWNFVGGGYNRLSKYLSCRFVLKIKGKKK